MGDAVDPNELTVGRRIAGDLIMMLAAIRIRTQTLTTVLQPAHGIVDLLRKPAERDLFPTQQSLVAKAAADIG